VRECASGGTVEWLHRRKVGGAGIALKPELAPAGEVLLAGLVLMEVSKDVELMSWAKLCGMAYALVMSWLPFLTGIHEHQI
jgi:hypothetical protein